MKTTGSLMRDRNFLLLWSGQFVSDFGSQLSIFALPVVAILVLHATALQVATLQSVEFATISVVAVIAGALADRHRRRYVMMVTNAVRLVTMLTIPIAYGLGRLTIAQLFICGIIASAASVMFDVAYQALVPSLVGSERLADGNAKLSMSGSVAEAVGQSTGGALVQMLGAPFAMLADALTFVISLTTLWRMRHDEPRRTAIPTTEEDRDESALRAFARETLAGFREVWEKPALRMVAMMTATNYLGGSIVTAVFPVLVYRQLHLPPEVLGVIMGVANVGMVGAFTAKPLQRLFGERGTLGSAVLISGIGKLLYVAANLSPLGAVLFGRLLITFAGPMYDVTQNTYRVAFIPEPLMGRVAAAFRALTWATLPVGSLLGGVFATSFGVQHTIIVGSSISFCAILWLGTRVQARHENRLAGAA
jgi:predicted MFS family arabinose efflux permease